MKINVNFEPGNQADMDWLVKMMSGYRFADAPLVPYTQESISESITNGRTVEQQQFEDRVKKDPVQKIVAAVNKAEMDDKQLADKVNNTAQAVVVKIDTPEKAAETVKIDVVMIRNKTQSKILAGHRDKIAAKLKEMEVASVSTMPKELYEQYNTFLETLSDK